MEPKSSLEWHKSGAYLCDWLMSIAIVLGTVVIVSTFARVVADPEDDVTRGRRPH